MSPSRTYPDFRTALVCRRQAGGAIGRRNYSFLTSRDGQQPSEPVDWAALFEDPTKPLVVDLGCGAGRYVLLMAHRKGSGKNYLGVDVHKAVGKLVHMIGGLRVCGSLPLRRCASPTAHVRHRTGCQAHRLAPCIGGRTAPR
jgi:hypothetical protein